MSCRVVLLIASMVVGCADDPAVIGITTSATEPIELAPADSIVPPDDEVSYRWDLVFQPDVSAAALPQGEASARFVPDVRGVYVVERWLAYGLSDRLTHQFVIQAVGVAPEASARGTGSVSVGTAAMLDATESHSVEALPLHYQWRLAERPRDSTAMIGEPQAGMTSFVPDVAGRYLVELTVFDGQLWSAPATLTVTAQ